MRHTCLYCDGLAPLYVKVRDKKTLREGWFRFCGQRHAQQFLDSDVGKLSELVTMQRIPSEQLGVIWTTFETQLGVRP